VDGEMDTPAETVYGLIPLTHIKPLSNGTHHVYVRGHDVAGNWGPLFAAPLVVDKVAPVLGTPVVTFTPSRGVPVSATLTAVLTETSGISAAEYWLGTTVPAAGKATATTWTVTDSATSPPVTSIGISVNLATVPAGNQQFNMRVKDGAGNWSKPASRVAFVVKPSPIFSDNFGSGTLSAWSAQTGAVTNVGNALRVSFASAPRVASYLTDVTPLSEPAYRAKFTFTPTGLTSGNANALTIFAARDITNRQVFSVQYRFNTVAPVGPQVRVVLSLNGTAADVVGAWYSVTAGQLIQVDWVAGNAGSLKLLTNGTLVQTLSGPNSGLRVDTVRLGVSAGQGLLTRGTATFDNFVSVRSTF
ncbi:MAG: hypothetical protein QOK14_1268, partial [Frankiaceae bacterium]|nr:hypothetical protein [Frankiaceae bacterium]